VKISIITAVLNGAQAIGATLESVREQDYPDIEHIVVDGASSDDTLAVVGQSVSRVSTVVSERDAGVYDAINRGIGLATGEVILCLHAGDTYQHAGVLSRIAQEFADPALDMVFAELVMTDPINRDRVYRHYATPDFTPSDFARGLMPAHPTLAVRRRVYDTHGRYDPAFKIAGDFEFFVRTMLVGKVASRYLPEVIVRMPLGGLSNRHWWVPITTTFELNRACMRHDVNTSWLRLLFRIILKWQTSVVR
jgi:glycosyltransferase involved in cell wall biosynthesis